MNRWLTFAMIALALVLLTGGALRPPAGAGTAAPRPEVGYAAPDFALPSVDGTEIRLSDLRGQGVFLNFWASWCPPCQMEMPAMQALQEQKRTGFRVVAVNMTHTESTPGAAVRFLRANGYTFATPFDLDGAVTRAYNIVSIPTSFFIDARGVIRAKVIGPMSLATMQDYARGVATGG